MPLLISVQLRKGDFAAANETATRVISEHPKAEYGYLLLAAIHQYRKEWSLAETVVKRGLKSTGDSIALNMNLAHIYSSQGKHENAQDVYNAILEKHADFIPAIFGNAAIYDLMGNKRQAQELYKEILEKNENYAPALNNLAYLYLDVYADPKEALKLAVKAFRNSPDDGGIIDTLGYALLKNGQVDKSLFFLEKAARLYASRSHDPSASRPGLQSSRSAR